MIQIQLDTVVGPVRSASPPPFAFVGAEEFRSQQLGNNDVGKIKLSGKTFKICATEQEADSGEERRTKNEELMKIIL